MENGRICTVCKEYKDYEFYHKNKSKKDGYNNACKTCKSISDKNSHQIHREKRISKMSERYEENKEKFLADCKIYRENNKDRIAQYKKEWHIRNKEVVNERSKVWREENSSRSAEAKKEWYRRNRDRAYASTLKRRARKHHRHFSKFKRSEILERDNWRCQLCGVDVHDRNTGGNENRHLWDDEFKAHIDHIIPLSKGGDSTIENLQVLCRTCNLGKSAKTDYEIDSTGQIKITLDDWQETKPKYAQKNR